jgi:hypothetical protein
MENKNWKKEKWNMENKKRENMNQQKKIYMEYF